MLNGLQNLAQMAREVAFAINDFTASKDAKIRQALNRRYLYVAGAFRWQQLEHSDESGLRIFSDITLPTLIGSEGEAPMPLGMGRLISLHHQDSRREQLVALQMREFYARANLQSSSQGRPLVYTKVGETAQYRRLAASGAVTAYSSTSANDALTARVMFRENAGQVGEPHWTDVAGPFVAGASVGGGVSLAEGYPIERVALPVAWTGTFELKDGSGNSLVLIQRIEEPATASNSTEVTYTRQLLRFWPVPDTGYGLTVTWLRDVQSLTEDDDAPLMPVSRALVEGAIADMLTQKGEDASRHEALFGQYTQVAAGMQMTNETPQVVPRGRNMKRAVGIWHY